MKCRHLELFIKILSVIFIWLANERILCLANESMGRSSNNDQSGYLQSTGAGCLECVQYQQEPVERSEPLKRVVKGEIPNHRLPISELPDKNNQIFSKRQSFAENPEATSGHQAYFENGTINLSLLNDSNSRTIYSSLIKILYHLKQQLNKDQQGQLEERADRKSAPLAFESPPNRALNANPAPAAPQTVQAAQTGMLTPPATVMDVWSEPLIQTEYGDQYNGNEQSASNGTNQAYLPNQFDENRLGDEESASNAIAAQDRWSTNGRADQKPQFQRAGEQPAETPINQPIQIPFSQKFNDNLSPKSWRFSGSSSKQSTVESPPVASYNGDNLGRPLFSFSTSADRNPHASGNEGFSNEIEPGGSFSTLSANGLRDTNQQKEAAPMQDTRFIQLGETAADDSYESVVATKRPRSRRPQPKLRSQIRQVYQKVNGPTYSGDYPMFADNLKGAGARSMRATDYSNAQRLPMIFVDQQEAERAYRPSEYQDSQRPRLEHTNIHLQQILPNPVGTSNAGHQQYNQQQSQQQQQQVQPQMVYSLAPTAPRTNTNSRANGQMSSSSSNINDQTNPSGAGSEQHQQRDLLNQPQTIQITAVPNGGFNSQPIVRVNGALGVNGLVNNGLYQPGYMDPFGRPLLMLNAERRQIDWSVWIWPLLVAVSLPILLGALFVPVFLKTVIVLIQVLQSLGLLQPITNALTQQISKAAGAPTINQTAEQVKT